MYPNVPIDVVQLSSDRRLLLEQVLKDYAKRGGRIVTPPSVPFNNPALLDSLDVAAVLRAVPFTGGSLELAKLSSSNTATNGRSPNPLPRPPPTNGAPADAIPIYTIKLESGWSATNNNSTTSSNHDNPFASPAVSAGGSAPNLSVADSNNPFTRPSRPGSGTGRPSPGGGPLMAALPPLPTQAATPPPARSAGSHARPASAPRGRAAPSSSEEDDEPGGVNTSLQLPLLETGVLDDHLKELAYFVFAAACPASSGPPAGLHRPPTGGLQGPGDVTGTMLTALRGQLELDEGRARDVASVMRHVATGYWTPQRRCSTEGLMTLLAQARPNDFNMLGGGTKGFRGWMRWRASLGHVMAAAADLKHAALQKGPESKRLVARLRGALRRLDVRTLEELDEEEYCEAAAALKDATRGLAFCGMRKTTGSGAGAGDMPTSGGGSVGTDWATFDSPAPAKQLPRAPPSVLVSVNSSSSHEALMSGAGWKLPWALRARIAEVLISALFDTINEGSYIDEVSSVQAALDAHVWPALGVSPTLALALAAWVHFRQYIATGHAWLARQLKVLISKLSTSVSSTRLQRSNAMSRRELVSPLTAEEEAEADSQVAAEVGRLVVERLLHRLSDYHLNYPPGSEQSFQVLLDTTVSAACARGDSEAQLAAMLVEVVDHSVVCQWRRLCTQRLDPSNEADHSLLLSLAFAEEVAKAEQTTYTPLLQPYLPHQHALVSARLHRAAGEQLLPWIRSGLSLDPGSVDVIRAAIILDKRLGGAVVDAHAALGRMQGAQQGGQQGEGGAAGVVLGALRGFMRWELDVPVQLAMDKWVGRRVESMSMWVDRQLGTEKWVAVSANDGYSQSSVEIVAMVTEAVEALFAMQLPVGQPALAAMLSGVDMALAKYAQHILARMGSPARFIPPMPTVTRYKKPFVVKQEEIEAELLAASTPGLAPRVKSKGTIHKLKAFGKSFTSSKPSNAPGEEQPSTFLESVPPTQSHPEYNQMRAMTPAVISCYIMSAHYLIQKLDGMTTAVRGRWAPPPPGSDSSWLLGAFKGCRHQLQQVCQSACVFLATKVVFWDMRNSWLEQLYRHHVASKTGSVAVQPPYSCRIDPLLDTLNLMLAEACGTLPDELRSLVATELLTAAATAWQRVLLDGGPCRWFIPADVAALRQDLDALQHLFEAEGEGLNSSRIEPILRPCRRLLLLVGCDLAQLMNMLKVARLHGRATLQMAGKEPEVFDEYAIMRTLARRPDRTGSKLLKKEYKMGRRLKPT